MSSAYFARCLETRRMPQSLCCQLNVNSEQHAYKDVVAHRLVRRGARSSMGYSMHETGNIVTIGYGVSVISKSAVLTPAVMAGGILASASW